MSEPKDGYQRIPGAFPLSPPARDAAPSVDARLPREPRSLQPSELVRVEHDPQDYFDTRDDAEPIEVPAAAMAKSRGSVVGRIVIGAIGILLSLAVGLWVDGLIRGLFERADWLGWLASGIAAVAASGILALFAREVAALRRLASVADMQSRAQAAAHEADPKAARAIAAELVAFTSGKPQTAAGRRAVAALEGEVVDGIDILTIAEREILGPLDAEARRLVLEAGKRVSVVTAVSPRAVVDVLYVVFESGRLIRRLAELYGGRPGTIGFWRLARAVVAHLAVTTSVAAGDSIVQQLVGHGLAARLSAKLGEGVINGMMTIRIGIAAMETARPLPFRALKRPGIADFAAALGRFWEQRAPSGKTAASEPRDRRP